MHFAHRPQCTVSQKIGSINAKFIRHFFYSVFWSLLFGSQTIWCPTFTQLNCFHQSISEHYENKNFLPNILKAVLPKYYQEGAEDVVACNQQSFFAFAMVTIRKKIGKNS